MLAMASGAILRSNNVDAIADQSAANPDYDLVADAGVQNTNDIEKFAASRKNMLLLAQNAFRAPHLRHILQFPTLPTDKTFATSTATICVEEEDPMEQDADLAGYLQNATSSSASGDHHQHGMASASKRSGSPWSMINIPSVGPDGKPLDFGKDLFGRSRNCSPLPFLYSLSRATSPCSFLLGSWYGGPSANATTVNAQMPEEPTATPNGQTLPRNSQPSSTDNLPVPVPMPIPLPKTKLPSRLSSASIVTESGDTEETENMSH